MVVQKTNLPVTMANVFQMCTNVMEDATVVMDPMNHYEYAIQVSISIQSSPKLIESTYIKQLSLSPTN